MKYLRLLNLKCDKKLTFCIFPNNELKVFNKLKLIFFTIISFYKNFINNFFKIKI